MLRPEGDIKPATYLGNSPSCYSNTLAMTLGYPVSVQTIDAISGSAFGYQRIGPLPLFDPPGWDPDQGIDQALLIMGVEGQRLTFEDPTEALGTLRSLAENGPVFVGPLEMGLLRYQKGSDRSTGADHFVAVLDVNDVRVIMHDPHGHPYASLATKDFMTAWGSDTIGYAEGSYPLRTGFTEPVGTMAEWAAASLPFALNWAEGNEAIRGFPAGNVEGLNELREQAAAGTISEVTVAVLRDFAIRLGARRRADTSDMMGSFPELADRLSRQAAIIGAAQISVIDADWNLFQQQMAGVVALHDDIVDTLRKLV